MTSPIRILTAVPVCDGHDSAINTINLELVRNGVEVVYLGYHRSARDIVRAAIQEDVRAVGISSYNGGHIEFFQEVIDRLRDQGSSIPVFGGGGGTITPADVAVMQENGVDRIFSAGTSLQDVVRYVQTRFAAPVTSPRQAEPDSDRDLAENLTRLATALPGRSHPAPGSRHQVIGFTGPGGAGKTTLIDELVLRFLRRFPPSARVAILSHDPSVVSSGALLGDRATMIYAQHDRVFLRSLATRGQAGGLSPATEINLDHLLRSGLFELILIETVGTGQEALPFGSMPEKVATSVLVMPPDYGSRLQLQKIAFLDAADLIVVNKGDLRGARTAYNELSSRSNPRTQRIVQTQANRHGDAGVDQLADILFSNVLVPEPVSTH